MNSGVIVIMMLHFPLVSSRQVKVPKAAAYSAKSTETEDNTSRQAYIINILLNTNAWWVAWIVQDSDARADGVSDSRVVLAGDWDTNNSFIV